MSRISILIPRILTSILCIPTQIPHIPLILTKIPRIPSPIPRIPILIPRIPLIPFSDFPFRLLQSVDYDLIWCCINNQSLDDRSMIHFTAQTLTREKKYKKSFFKLVWPYIEANKDILIFVIHWKNNMRNPWLKRRAAKLFGKVDENMERPAIIRIPSFIFPAKNQSVVLT